MHGDGRGWLAKWANPLLGRYHGWPFVAVPCFISSQRAPKINDTKNDMFVYIFVGNIQMFEDPLQLSRKNVEAILSTAK
jgi:hypothetical protein